MVTARRGSSSLGCLLTMLIVAAVLYFGVNIGEVYWHAYEFQDDMRQEAKFAKNVPNDSILVHLRSAADSLGIYVTWQPAPGAVDSARNCLSNIRPEGMPVAEAAAALTALFDAARRYRITGIGLSQRLAIERK